MSGPEGAAGGDLPPPARYFPIRGGRYDLTPGLRALGTDLGGGAADALCFQFDREFPRYRENRLRCRAERLEKYAPGGALPAKPAAAAARFLIRRLTGEHPAWFAAEPRAGGAISLRCRLTGERLLFDAQLRLAGVEPEAAPHPPYRDAWDALCSQLQEDAALVWAPPGAPDRLAALHVCSPSHWIPEEKLGLGFAAVHAPVPGIEPVTRVSGAMVHAMVHRGPFVRFVWGISADRRLNRHPHPPPGAPAAAPPFDPAREPPFYLRVERQVTCGLPEGNAALFLIRLSFVDGAEIRSRPEERTQLAAALRSMSPASRLYKGVDAEVERIAAWLEA